MTDIASDEEQTVVSTNRPPSSKPERPDVPAKRARHLVEADQLHALLQDDQGPHPDDIVLCHAHFVHPDDYEAGHIPGAIPLDTTLLESTETWNRRPAAELEDALTSLGIRHDTTVVLYGRYSHPTYEEDRPGRRAGQIAAMRCALILLYAGVEDVRVLDGGIDAWEAAGYELTTEPTRPRPVDSFGVEIPAHPEYIVDLPEADRLRRSDDGVLVDFRSQGEHVGEWSGYHYIEDTGRIPGSVFGRAGSDAYHVETLRNPDGTTRDLHEIAEAWAEEGIVPDKHVAFYCGTGWRASEAFFVAWLMDWPRISVYDGGWYEWIRAGDAPVAAGPP